MRGSSPISVDAAGPSGPVDPVTPPPDALLLALDTASPTVSVAVGRDGRCLAARSVELRRSSEALLRLVDEALGEAGVALRDLDGIVALRGPGSFTGLRVGLATVLGLHQALGVAATAVPTHDVLEVAARAVRPDGDGRAAAVVDALRGQWFTRIFGLSGEPPDPAAAAAILDPDQIAGSGPALLVGHGAERLAADPAWSSDAGGRSPRARPVVLDLSGADWPGPTLAEAALLHHARRLPKASPWDSVHAHQAALPAGPRGEPARASAGRIGPGMTMRRDARPRPGDAGATAPRTLREARSSDLPALVSLERVCFTPPWSENLLRLETRRAARARPGREPRRGGPARRLRGLPHGRRRVGAPAGRGAAGRPPGGVGRALVEAGLDAAARRGAARCFLEVRGDNGAAIALYRALGFNARGTRSGYYPDGTDALLMARELATPPAGPA